jgi:hypothetical protein
MEIKEWQAIMEYLKALPEQDERGVARLTMDERAEEDRAIKQPES